ncbi:hypothetical protein L596_004531 [Steinernema carpocapsae]|uniref:Uncharacterized protein n=1 Tax=Steinernema carpocapsae TaxID=34508 RepID=A0A4U8UW23_STECR|nr:hypothetical protein L596_004531 [Steinernema carpocapsae]
MFKFAKWTNCSVNCKRRPRISGSESQYGSLQLLNAPQPSTRRLRQIRKREEEKEERNPPAAEDRGDWWTAKQEN